ncbi:hypothetical protein Bca4012_020391 [Brassica carinata]
MAPPLQAARFIYVLLFLLEASRRIGSLTAVNGGGMWGTSEKVAENGGGHHRINLEIVILPFLV